MLSGQILGKYEILAEIGHGTFGRVYEAKDGVEGGVVALKILPASPELREQHIKEAKVMRQLDHPNIVHIYNADFIANGSENNFVIAMEYLPLGLDKLLLEANRLPTEGAIDIASQVLEALCYAHAKGIIHHDIKPANIRLTKRDHIVKIVDFGLSEELGTYSHAKGFSTYAYMAPECYGEENRYDYQSELWAVGVLLFKMLTGRLPFNAPHRGDPYSWQAEVKKKSHPPLKFYLDDVQPRLQEILDRALARDARARYTTSREFLQALQALQMGNTAGASLSDDQEKRTDSQTLQVVRPPILIVPIQAVYGFSDKILKAVQRVGASFYRYLREQPKQVEKGYAAGLEATHSAGLRLRERIKSSFVSADIGMYVQIAWYTVLLPLLVGIIIIVVLAIFKIISSYASNHAGPSPHNIGATQKSAIVDNTRHDENRNKQHNKRQADHKAMSRSAHTLFKEAYKFSEGKQYSAAIALYKKVISLDPDLAVAYNNLAYNYEKVNDNQDAVHNYQEAVRLDPHNAKYLNNLAIIYDDMHDWADALEMDRKSLHIKPENQEVRYQLVENYVVSGDRAHALEQYRVLKRSNAKLAAKLARKLF